MSSTHDPSIALGPGITSPRFARPAEPGLRPPFRQSVGVHTRDPSVGRSEGGVGYLDLPHETLEGRGEVLCSALFTIEPPPGFRVDRFRPSRNLPEEPGACAVQMAYAVASHVFDCFRQALSRVPDWTPARAGRPSFARLGIVLGVPDLANAWYDPDQLRLVFGRFSARDGALGRIQAGALVDTARSHDIVAHEMAHALLDGARPHLMQPSNLDVPAFHEAFADMVAMFTRIAHEAPLRRAIERGSGDVVDELLTSLAAEFGRGASGGGHAMRTGLLEIAEPGTELPARYRYSDYTEPHARGQVLVSAVFEAYRVVYRRRTRAIALATHGHGPGPLPAPVVDLMAREARKLARHFFQILVRAVDYMPPVDPSFGDYLRALITADSEQEPEDPWHYREALISAFRRWGIPVPSVTDLSEYSLRWDDSAERIDAGALQYMARRMPVADWVVTTDNATSLAQRRQRRAGFVAAFLRANRHQLGVLGLVTPGGDFGPITISSVRGLRRRAHGGSQADFVIEIIQSRRVDGLAMLGGCTLIVDDRGNLRYVVRKRVSNDERAMEMMRFLATEGRHWRNWMLSMQDPLSPSRAPMMRALDVQASSPWRSAGMGRLDPQPHRCAMDRIG